MTASSRLPHPPARGGETGSGAAKAGVLAPLPAHRTISSVYLPDGQLCITCTCGYTATDRRRRAQARFHNHGTKTPLRTFPGAAAPTK